jgi:transcriptional regulator with GAF, ATPase, and Fis domain
VAFSRPDDFPPEAAVDRRSFEEWEIRSGLIVPIIAAGATRFFLSMASDAPGHEWPDAYIPQLQLLGKVFTDALAHQRAETLLKQSYEEIQALRERLQAETDYLRDEVKLSHRFADIVGQSEAIRRVLALVQQVAPTDSPVLIQGETGTGKELVAQAIHNLSGRNGRVLVKVNCASLPATLIESELFGREKGAYTGALTKQIGRFELANDSTIFLDEIGELPPEMQAKLLRVLQSGEFERLGSPKTIRVNVRVIAATNRDLLQEVRQGRFRQDLYYRLNVFPIVVPPLRERREDIPQLVWAILDELQKRMGKRIQAVPKRVMESLVRYAWPGNVRELRNILEHGVLASSGDTLVIELPTDNPGEVTGSLTLEEVEKRHIQLVLERTSGRIKGAGGAAEILGLNPSTLYTRMEKLGLSSGRKKDGIPS